jgi:hypothetical protein
MPLWPDPIRRSMSFKPGRERTRRLQNVRATSSRWFPQFIRWHLECSNLQAITPFAIDLHDIIISKLGRYHAKDRADIELLTRLPKFDEEQLAVLYAQARDDLKTYWPDKLEPTDKHFNLMRTSILGLAPEDWLEGGD